MKNVNFLENFVEKRGGFRRFPSALMYVNAQIAHKILLCVSEILCVKLYLKIQ